MTTGTASLLASGSLAETPFAHLMLYLYRQAGTGTLFVRSGGGAEVVVHVEAGRAMAARSTEGGVDMMGALLPACGFNTGEFAFYSGDHIDAVQGALEGTIVVQGSLDPYALLYGSLREHARDDMVEGVLARYPSTPLVAPTDRDVTRLELDEQDRTIFDMLRERPMTIDEVVMGSPLPGLHTRRLLYALLVTHMLAPHASRSGEIYKSQVDREVPADVSRPPATPSRHATLDSRRTGERSIPPPSSGKPPTRIIVHKPAVAGSVNDIASAAMPAWQQLMSMRPPPSGDPRRSLEPPPPRAPAQLRGSLSGLNASDPAAKRRRAEGFMQSGKFSDALALLDELASADASDAKLHGLRARALFEVHKNDKGGLPKAVLEAARKAHEIDGEEANAYFVRGLIYKQAGETNKALACWKRTLVTDPKHLDAQREIRIAQMRK